MAAISAQLRQAPKDQWITPQEQLQRLGLPIRKKIAWVASEYFSPGPAGIVAEYCGSQLDPNTTHWFTALERLGALPEKIPPLPHHVHHILAGKCPVYSHKKKTDRTPYTIGDTHALMLVPEEFRTLDDLAAIVNAYGIRALGQQAHPFRIHFRMQPDGKLAQYRNEPFLTTHWVLMLKHLLQPTFSDSFPLDSLNKKSFTQYQKPSVQDAATTMLLHKIATEETMYPGGASYADQQLCIGDMDTWGLTIADPKYSRLDGENITFGPDIKWGIGALRIL